MAVADKIMFEIYREAGYGQKFCVVYFTELDDHNKEQEISRAMTGEHLFDGFIAEKTKDQAKQAVNAILERLNQGETINEEQVGQLLQDFIAQ